MRRGLGLGLARNRGNSFARFDDFLLRDEFLTDEAAPLASPRSCEPGPGSLVITDVDNSVSIVGDELVYIDSPTTNPDINSVDSFGAISGISSLAKIKCDIFSTNALEQGFQGLFLRVNGQLLANRFLGYLIDSPGISDYFVYATIRQSDNYAIYIFNFKIAWVGIGSGIKTLTAGKYNKTWQGKTKWLRVAQLGSPWDTDFGIATDRLAGARLAGDTFTHEADCLIEFEITTLGTGAVRVRFRKQDSSNTWYIEISATGNFNLFEVVGGGATIRGAAAGVLSGGERIVIICDDETISGYYDNSLAWSYSSAANFKTETNGELWTLNAGVVSDIVTWPRVLNGAALTELLKYTT